jgi:hypothetical protein
MSPAAITMKVARSALPVTLANWERAGVRETVMAAATYILWGGADAMAVRQKAFSILRSPTLFFLKCTPHQSAIALIRASPKNGTEAPASMSSTPKPSTKPGSRVAGAAATKTPPRSTRSPLTQ